MSRAPDSGSKSEASALRFGSHQDACDYTSHLVNEANRRLAAQNLDAADRYRKGEVAAYARGRYLRNGDQYHLVFLRIPPADSSVRVGDASAYHSLWKGGVEIGAGLVDREGNERAVFLGISNLVYGPEGVIPSFITLELFKEVLDFRGQILASAGQVVSPFLLGRTERELGGPQAGALGGDGACVAGLVEYGTQVIGDVEEDAGKRLRQLTREFDFVNILSRIRLTIFDVGPRLSVDKVEDYGVEFTDVMLCAFEGEPRATEDVSHGRQIRSDERPRVPAGAREPVEEAAEARKRTHLRRYATRGNKISQPVAVSWF